MAAASVVDLLFYHFSHPRRCLRTGCRPYLSQTAILWPDLMIVIYEKKHKVKKLKERYIESKEIEKERKELIRKRGKDRREVRVFRYVCKEIKEIK